MTDQNSERTEFTLFVEKDTKKTPISFCILNFLDSNFSGCILLRVQENVLTHFYCLELFV